MGNHDVIGDMERWERMAKKERTFLEAGKELRDYAEMTAKHWRLDKQNWDNFEQIAITLLKQAYENGKEKNK